MEQENVNLVNENESGFSLSDLLYLIKKNLLLIIIIVSAALVCGFVYGRFINKPTYSAKITTIVQADTNQAESTNYNYGLALTKSFPELIKSDSVTPLVAKEALLLYYDEQIDGENKTYKNKKTGEVISEDKFTNLVNNKAKVITANTNVTASSTSLLLYITYSTKLTEGYTEAELVEEIKVITDALAQKTIEYYGATDSEGKEIFPNFANKLIQLTHARSVTVSRGLAKILLIALAIGLVLCFAIIFIRYLIDDTLTSKDEIERITGKPVLAYIEKSEKKVGNVYGSK